MNISFSRIVFIFCRISPLILSVIFCMGVQGQDIFPKETSKRSLKKSRHIRPEGTLYRPDAKTLPEKGYEFEVKGKYFQTESVFDFEGSEFVLDEGESNIVIDSDLYLHYGLGDDLQLSGGIRYRQVSQKYNLNNENISAIIDGVESYYFQLRYSLKASKKLLYSLNLQARQTAYTNTSYASTTEIPESEIVLGDSGGEYSAGVSLSYMRTPSHYLNGTVAYRQPGNELSAEAPFDFNTVWTWEDFALELGAEGVYSFGGDEYGSAPLLKRPQGRGSSLLFNSINREWLSPKVGAFYAIGSGGWRMGFQASRVYTGISTDRGTSFTLSLKKTSRTGKTQKTRKKEKFKEYTIEGTIIKVSPRGQFIQIDLGLSQDVEKGMVFDIYKTNFFGGNELVASAIAYEVGFSKTILKVSKIFTNTKVKKGFVARSE